MKIIKKISLRRGLNRIVEPNLAYPKITRHKNFISSPYDLTPEDQIHKYSTKPKYVQFKWYWMWILGGVFGVFWKVYEQQMYTNQLDTIYRYRFHELEVGSVKLYSRLFFLKILLWLQNNYWIGALSKKQNIANQNMDYYAECMIRYGQYKNYQQKKDRKFDFLDVGVLEKFPYPKRMKQPGMD